MKTPQWWRIGFAAAVVAPMVVVAWAGPGAADPAGDITADPAAALTEASRHDAVKAPTSRAARTDPSLLGRTDSTLIPVLVKLDNDSVATYTGEVAGYAATSPAVTGRDLSGSPAERRYESYLAQQEAAFVAALKAEVPQARVGQSLRTVYGGVAALVPADQVRDVLAIDGVAAVQKDEPRQLLTDSSPEFIGADTLYSDLGGDSDAGKGVTIGVLDTGAWPEHPSFADQGNLDPRPGPALACDFGDNPLTPASDPFGCNNKLVGGLAFLDTYLSDPGRAAAEQYHTARDSNGHGTHTASTAAGNALDSAPVFGVERGPLNGVAPGAWVSVYKVCGVEGCFPSDSAAAVAQAIVDGVNVINFSISGGNSPFTDPVELAFLDAYAAGVFVSTSAGNDGPGAASVNHVSPWVTTVAASTQRREFNSTLSLTADNGDTLELTGASITAGVSIDSPVVLSSAAPYSDPLCESPAPAGLFTGVIVACERGVNARVEKGYNVLQGGASGMILYNPALADIETDNHWLPTVHLADGTDFVAFMSGHTGVSATFTAGQAEDGQPDVMAAFSSRGPGGLGIKPDVTAPGVQILAGHTPTPQDIVNGPPGELFQAIAGTSMSSPHVAGSALLLKALHPDWTPGQIKSALMTTADRDGVVKEDLTTPADPFDRGSGRIDLDEAGSPSLTLDETPANMVALGNDPLTAVHLNLASINAPVMPGRLVTTRTVTNVTDRSQTYRVGVSAPDDSRISVSPSRFTVGAGDSRELRITITSDAPTEQLFGEIRIDPTRSGLPTQHLTVAFVPQQGEVALTSSCSPTEVNWLAASTCTITATNNSSTETTVDLTTKTDLHLLVTGATNATVRNPFTVETSATLAAALPPTPSVAPGPTPAGYLPLSLFPGNLVAPVGDETIVNINVPELIYAGETYSQIGVTSNGYIVVGGGGANDVEFEPPGIPNPAPPNNVLAPFWTDLDGTSSQGILANVLTDGVNDWLVVEWHVNVWGTTSLRTFQVWIGVNGVEDISYTYDPANLPAASGFATVVGAENSDGSAGDQLPDGTLPTEDLVVTSSAPEPGGSVTYTVRVRGLLPGTGDATTTMDSPVVPGTTVVRSEVKVKKHILGWF